jgi:pentatricopeptide repeat protein
MPTERLDSWKAVAAYLKRDVTTVQRWERREGMPIHRHIHNKRGSVYALTYELDAWRQSRVALLAGDGEVDKAQAEIGVGASVAQPEGVAGETALNGVADRVAPRASKQRRWLLVALALLGVSAGLYVFYKDRLAHSGPQAISSLAVLPLQNISGDPTQEYLADGMTEALIGRLAGIRGLRVVSHTSVMRFKNPQISVHEIGRTLGAEAIVEGSVTRVGNRIRVTAQLIRAGSDEHLWSETYDRDLQDVLELEGELAQSIAERVEVTLTGKERERLAATRSIAPEVYESYLKGEFALNNSKNRDGITESLGYFENATRLDPTFAPGYLGVARAFSSLGTVFMGGYPAETRPKVLSAARKAVELDPDLAEAHVLLATTEQEQWHWAQAEGEYRRALDLGPNDALARIGFANWLMCQGRTDEALTWAQRARRLDPVAVSGGDVAWILFQSHRFEQALREVRSDLAVDPNSIEALTTLGFVLGAGERSDEGVTVLERVVADTKGSPAATGILIRAYARSGRRGDALRLLDELKRRKAAGYVPAAAFVNAYLGLDDKDEAFAWLERAYEEQSNILQFLKVHPYFDPLRGDPRFIDLVRRVWSDTT